MRGYEETNSRARRSGSSMSAMFASSLTSGRVYDSSTSRTFATISVYESTRFCVPFL